MAFEGLSSKLQSITNKFKGKVRVTEADLKDMLREVKLALLEADVNYKIVKEFIAVIQEKALGQDVLKSLTPGQQVIKIVKDELVELLGGTESKITFLPNAPTVIMLIGLQGSGKTTTAGKLANVLRKQGKKPLLVACDVYRPAAIKQLQVVGKQLNIPVFSDETSKNVVNIAKRSIDEAIKKLNDVIILDTCLMERTGCTGSILGPAQRMTVRIFPRASPADSNAPCRPSKRSWSAIKGQCSMRASA